MPINTDFWDWSSDEEDPAYNRCSPNLRAILAWSVENWGTTSLGCYGERPVRGGVRPSPHSHGAAIDIRYGTGADRRALCEDMIIPTLIRNSQQLHVQRIGDYIGQRIWTAGRTKRLDDAETKWWKRHAKGDGFGESWAVYLHIETTPDGWLDGRNVNLRTS